MKFTNKIRERYKKLAFYRNSRGGHYAARIYIDWNVVTTYNTATNY